MGKDREGLMAEHAALALKAEHVSELETFLMDGMQGCGMLTGILIVSRDG